MNWITPSTYAPSREAKAHRRAAKRNPKKAKQHMLAAHILEGGEHTPDDEDRIAVQRTCNARRDEIMRFNYRTLGVL